ncbi:MAG: peptidylprolyl isomerase [Rhodothermales bacterium]
MTRRFRLPLLALLAALVAGCAGTREAAEPGPTPLPATNYYEIATPLGALVIRLSDATPVHRDNFKKLVAESFYDGTTFHRVIRGFMAQGGDPNTKDDDPINDGQGGPGYTLPAEIVPGATHTIGALAAARQADQVNPERRSSGSQFYLVTGNASHLDGQYTIFGEVVQGLDVLARIELAETARSTGRRGAAAFRDRPFDPIPMTVRPLPDYAELRSASGG